MSTSKVTVEQEDPKWKKEKLQKISTSDFRWQIIKDCKEEWRSELIQACEVELVAILISKAKSQTAANEIQSLATKLEEGDYWKLEFLSRARNQLEIEIVKSVQNENALDFVFKEDFAWLREIMFELIKQTDDYVEQKIQASGISTSDKKLNGKKKANKLEVGRLSLLSKCKLRWQAELLSEIFFDGKELFDEKAEIIIACKEKDMGMKVLESPDWKIPYLLHSYEKMFRFRALLKDIPQWKCDLLSRSNTPLVIQLVDLEESQIKAEALFENISAVTNWKREIIHELAESEEWKLKYLFDCEEHWKAKAIVKCTEEEDWKIPMITKESNAKICKLIIEKCGKVFQANYLRAEYVSKPWLGDMIPKVERDEEAWLLSKCDFEWQAELAFNCLKESFTKAVIISKTVDFDRAKFVAAAKEEWRFQLLSDVRHVDDWVLPFVAEPGCTETKAVLIASCNYEWQARMVLEADSDWKAELLQKLNQEWRGKLIMQEPLEWKAKFMANKEFMQYKVELMSKVNVEWKVTYISLAEEFWRANLVNSLKDSQQVVGDDLLNKGQYKSEEEAKARINQESTMMYS